MAHKTGHEKLTAWVPTRLVKKVDRKAKANGRNRSQEIRLALAAWANGKDSA